MPRGKKAMQRAKEEAVKRGMMRPGSGFSLIELLIVVAIILIISAIAIPNFLRSRMAASESSAVQSLRNIVTATVVYSSTYSNGYPPSLGALGGPGGVVIATCDNALLIDNLLSNNGAGNTGTKTGYNFTYVPGAAIVQPAPGCTAPGVLAYELYADPTTLGFTGQRRFYIDQSGVVRFTTNGTKPTATSTPIQ